MTLTLTIELPEEQTQALKAKAMARGISTEQYARQVLEHDLAPEWLRKSWKAPNKWARISFPRMRLTQRLPPRGRLGVNARRITTFCP